MKETSTTKTETKANFDAERFAGNMTLALQAMSHSFAEWLKSQEKGQGQASQQNTIALFTRALMPVAQYWLSDPERSLEAQKKLLLPLFDVWSQTLHQQDKTSDTVTHDKRFRDEAWKNHPFFAVMRQIFETSSRWAEKLVEDTQGLDEDTKAKALFFTRQLMAAVSPANSPLTNPEVLKCTLETSGKNLAEGLTMLAQDMAQGQGMLKLRQTDAKAFKVGENLATTPGKVIYRNDLMELIQYSPSTNEVVARPLLFVPPWINKYYILDLSQEKSYVKWCVDQGFTVFLISWVNPNEKHAHKTFLDYIREGLFSALDIIHEVTGERQVAAVGYCVGGTMLATALALMASRKDDRITHATFLTTQVDFTNAGELKVFVGEKEIEQIEREMAHHGYLPSWRMASTFNMLRPNDLIWPYVIETYFKGHQPSAFDLLYWNSDSTRMASANHSFYLRQFYLHNNLARGQLSLDHVRLDLSQIKIPLFHVATKEDHIAPAESVYAGARMFGGPQTFVLAASGHIAGVINPPTKQKYHYWTGPNIQTLQNLDEWRQKTQQHQGSWWPYWAGWLKAQLPHKTTSRIPGQSTRAAICDAPGTYIHG